MLADYIDFTSRTLGSIANNFGNPTRYDNDMSYISPRVAGFLLEGHYALPETTAGIRNQAVYLASLDDLNGPYRVGYSGRRAKPPAGATYSEIDALWGTSRTRRTAAAM